MSEFSVRQADERLPSRRLAATAVLAAVVGGLSVIVSWRIGRLPTREATPAPVPFVAPAPLGTVERGLTVESRGLDRVAAQRKRLTSCGWVDHDRGIAHIPIDRAIELTAESNR